MIEKAMHDLGREAVLNKAFTKNGKCSIFVTNHSEATKLKQKNKALERWSSMPDEEKKSIFLKSAKTKKLRNAPSPLKGRPSPIAGIPKTKEAREKMSRARKGIVLPHMKAPRDRSTYELINLSTKQTIQGNRVQIRDQTGLDHQELYNLIKGHVRWSKGWALITEEGSTADIPRKPNPTNYMKLKCPHCGSITTPGNAKRWHFDNCKLKTSFEAILLP